MRNLKKILALVLALVMSLSLMATASAGSFQDVTDDNPYATAIDVLDQLKVFQGFEDGTFKPTDTLTRAQAAVLVYRIATGDVEGKHVAAYTEMANSKFEDLTGYNWAKGYINYCQNAKYVIGTDATHFAPGAKVTGYQLLVMLLRVLGYGQAGEFSNGRTWELETAKIAEREHILQNITTDKLGEAAPRQMVAEILFRGLLTKTVQYSIMTPDGYTPGETLGKREFGLEEIEGVVMANEWANLDDVDVLSKGKTQILVNGEDKARTLDITTPITYVGENFSAYIAKTKVLTLENTDNTVWEPENGKATDISSSVKFEKATGLQRDSDTEYFRNFDKSYQTRSEWTIRYRVDEDTAPQWVLDYMAEVGAAKENKQYVRTFPFNTEIPETDIDIMKDIFRNADRNQVNPDPGNPVGGFVTGEVYAGTSSLKDLSDSKAEGGITWNEFVATYLLDVDVTGFGGNANGQWLKVVDNDGDGVAEYVFLTNYWLDEVISSYKNKAGDTVMQYNRFNDDDNELEEKIPTVYMEGTDRVERGVAVGDVVLVARIDNQFLVSDAQSVTAKASSYNYKDDEIKTADGDTYGQSGIWKNYTDMQDIIANMAPNTDYEMFLDKFGYVRAYRQPGGTKYALVTELYYTNGNYGNLEQNWPMTAELTMPDENGKPVTKEYPVADASQLTAKAPWTLVNSRASTGRYYNWLQPAIAHLGVTRTGYKPTTGTPTFKTTDPLYSVFWANDLQLVRNIDTWGAALQEFNYGQQVYGKANPADADFTQNGTSSFTNIAVVNGEDKVTLTGAAQVRLGTDGQPVRPAGDSFAYAVDYVQLSTARPAAKAASYTISNANAADDNSATGYEARNNYYVNADKDTEIYIVYDKGVQYFKGYTNMPALTESLVGKIHAAYAVARNTATGTSERNYWMADVIVYEVEKWDDLSKASISLAYYTASQQLQSASSVTINTLNSAATPAKVDLTPAGMNWNNANNWWGYWGDSWKGYGFYQLYSETLPAEGESVMTAKKIEAITEKFADYGIYAGTVTQEIETAVKGDYIPVNMYDAYNIDGNAASGLKTDTRVSISDTKVYSITDADWTNNTSYNYYTEANNLQYSNVRWSEVKAGDRIIWVGKVDTNLGVSTSSFIVDLGNPDVTEGQPLLNNRELWLATPWWLGGGSLKSAYAPTVLDRSKTLWGEITTEQQNPKAPGKDFKVTVNVVDSADKALLDPLTYEVDKNGTVFIKESDIQPANTTISSVKNVTLDNADVVAATVNGVSGYQITGVTKNMTVKVTLTKTAQDLSLTLAPGGFTLSGANLQASFNDNALANYTSGQEVGVVNGANKDVFYGDTYKFVLKGLDNTQYEYTITPANTAGLNEPQWTKADDGSDTLTITGKILSADVDLTLTRSARDNTTITPTLSGHEEFNLKTKLVDNTTANADVGGAVLTGQDIVFTVKADDTYAISAVTITQLGKAVPATMTEADDGTRTYTIDKEYNNTKNIKIDVTTVSNADFTVTITRGTLTGNTLYVNGGKGTGDNRDLPYTGGTITIEADNPIDVALTTGNAADVDLTHSDDYRIWTVEATAAVTVTVNNRADIEDDVFVNTEPKGEENVDPDNGVNYSTAYAAAGITVTNDKSGNAIINVDKAQFDSFIGKYSDANVMGQIMTLRPKENHVYTQDFLAAGAIFAAPTGAVKVKIGESDTSAADAVTNAAAAGEEDIKAPGVRGTFDANGVHIYLRFTNTNTSAWEKGTAADSTYKGTGIAAIEQTRVKYVCLTFIDGEGNEASVVRTVTLNVG